MLALAGCVDCGVKLDAIQVLGAQQFAVGFTHDVPPHPRVAEPPIPLRILLKLRKLGAQPLYLSRCRVLSLGFRSARVEQFANQFVMRSRLLALLLLLWFYSRPGFVLFVHRHLQKSALAIRHLTIHSSRAGTASA